MRPDILALLLTRLQTIGVVSREYIVALQLSVLQAGQALRLRPRVLILSGQVTFLRRFSIKAQRCFHEVIESFLILSAQVRIAAIM